jgi:hypothetical protein
MKEKAQALMYPEKGISMGPPAAVVSYLIHSVMVYVLIISLMTDTSTNY